MNWLRFKMTTDDITSGKGIAFDDKCRAIWAVANYSRDVEVLNTRMDENGDVYYYLSPAASKIFAGLITEFAQELTGQPDKESLGIVLKREV